MARISVYNPAINREFLINVELNEFYAKDAPSNEVGLLITTNILKQPENESFGFNLVKDLSDVPPDSSATPTNFNELMNEWIVYFLGMLSSAIIGSAVVGDTVIE